MGNQNHHLVAGKDSSQLRDMEERVLLAFLSLTELDLAMTEACHLMGGTEPSGPHSTTVQTAVSAQAVESLTPAESRPGEKGSSGRLCCLPCVMSALCSQEPS